VSDNAKRVHRMVMEIKILENNDGLLKLKFCVHVHVYFQNDSNSVMSENVSGVHSVYGN